MSVTRRPGRSQQTVREVRTLSRFDATPPSLLIQLTDEGVALAEAAVRANSAAHAEVLAGVPEEALATAATALREVHLAVQQPQPGRALPARRYRQA